jgi:EF-P beta-lysylation protein EpmB
VLVPLDPSVPLWKKVLRSNFINWQKLADFLELDTVQREKISAKPRFTLNLPARLAQKIQKKTLDDPILKQFLPTLDEQVVESAFMVDPVGDNACRVSQKLLHKYLGRVLLICTSACAMHCRYCFRQHFDYEVGEKLFENEIQMIQEDSTIHEIILSGGDPLSLDNKVLKNLLEKLSSIPHIKKIRFHTRFPIGIPERIDQDFLDLLDSIPCQFWFVLHINHPRELDEDVLKAIKSLQKLGIPVLNQSVLLRGINDQIDVLTALCEKLVDHGVLPYYLHQLDRVQGAAHFEVSEQEGKSLIAELTARLPGYAVPRYVKEISGMPSKTAIL